MNYTEQAHPQSAQEVRPLSKLRKIAQWPTAGEPGPPGQITLRDMSQ